MSVPLHQMHDAGVKLEMYSLELETVTMSNGLVLPITGFYDEHDVPCEPGDAVWLEFGNDAVGYGYLKRHPQDTPLVRH